MERLMRNSLVHRNEYQIEFISIINQSHVKDDSIKYAFKILLKEMECINSEIKDQAVEDVWGKVEYQIYEVQHSLKKSFIERGS